MELQLISTKDHLFLIDTNQKGAIGYNYNTALSKVEFLQRNYPEHSSEWNYCTKIVAYFPLKWSISLHDLPLLPNPIINKCIHCNELIYQEWTRYNGRWFHSANFSSGCTDGKQAEPAEVQLPNEFIPEYKTLVADNSSDFMFGSSNNNFKQTVYSQLKFIENDQGHKELVGTYKF